jgi:predicted amidohydrolase YtcJ
VESRRSALLFTGGPVFGHPDGTAVLTRSGRIAAVGELDEVESVTGTSAERIDLAGRMLTPGFQDAHVHPVMGGLQRLRCDLEPAVDLESGLAIIRRHVAGGRSDEWVLGGGWRYRWFAGGNAPAELLDQITERPVWLMVADGHSGWANGTALRLAGIDAGTPDPPDGVIARLPDGSPQGTLHEGAVELMERVVPPDDPSDIRAALLESQEYFLSLGITAWQDAWVTPDVHEAYLATATSGELRCRVRGALWWDRDRDIGQLDEIIERSRQSAPNYVPGTVKLMLDGVCENFTASMLEGYLDGDGRPTGNRGLDFIQPEELKHIVAAIDAAGLQCHFHALGDRAVRNALDAIEHARNVNGRRDTRPHLAHVQVIDPTDVARFAALGATANIQPLWACADPAMTELTLPFLPADRHRHQYPFRSLMDAGAVLAMGSDWSVSTPDVMQQVGVASTRSRPSSGIHEAFLPDQRISIHAALMAATAGSARINFHDHDSGVIEPGYRADLAVLSGDPTRHDPFGLNVAMTILEGDIAFRS